MNKILLALTLLGAGAGAFVSARQSTTRLQHEAQATRESWLAQTQLVAVAQSDQAALSKRVHELRQALAQPPAVEESALWSALQTNGVGHLTPELRERLLLELGFNWQSSPDYIVVSKETVREIQMPVIDGGSGNPRQGPSDGMVTDISAIVLAMRPAERGQLEAAMQRVRTDFKEWALAHVERSEPKDDVVAQYSLPGDPDMVLSISNNFATGVFEALGRERAELILSSPANWNWIRYIGIRAYPTTVPTTNLTTMIIQRYQAGNEQRLKVQTHMPFGKGPTFDLWRDHSEAMFPKAFLPIFPDGWADVAKREGFELPEKSPQK